MTNFKHTLSDTADRPLITPHVYKDTDEMFLQQEYLFENMGESP